MDRIKQSFEPKTIPLHHQIEAINYITEREFSALFDEQGLGKTKIVIDSLCFSLKQGIIDAVLVVAPLTLLYNWEQEVRKHSYLFPIVFRGTKREVRYKILTGANFYIINYEMVLFQLERIKRFCKSKNMAIVLDEASRIKSPSAKVTKAILELSPLSKKRIIITGTPIANKPIDLWALFYFLDQGKLLGDDFNNFRKKLDEKSSDYIDNLSEIQKVIDKSSIRRLKHNVLELPEKVFHTVEVELENKQSELYVELKENLKIEITNLDGKIIIDESNVIVKKLLRLIQIACNPYLLNKTYSETPAKFKKLDEMLIEITKQGDKAIIWTSFIENIIILKDRYKQFKPLTIYGEMPISERPLIVNKFQESCENKIMIANPAAAREGLTLTKANHAIYLDRSFNLIDYLQSQDRIHRISQTKKCNIYKLIAKDTIDEYVDRIIDLKTDIAGFVQSDKENISLKSIDTLFNKQALLKLLGG
jgi:SWI/SNF-related matrix-associated actin-dependent regulator 1 of chromatin subfamily A